MMTRSMVAVRWLAETVTPHRKAARTADYYQQVLHTHLLPAFGTTALTEVNPANVRAFIAEKMAGRRCGQHMDGVVVGCATCVRALAKNTVKNAVATLRAILYQVDELIPANPAARFGKLFDLRQDKRKNVTVLEPTQVARVLQTANEVVPGSRAGDTDVFSRYFAVTVVFPSETEPERPLNDAWLRGPGVEAPIGEDEGAARPNP